MLHVRSLVKVVNATQVLRASGSPDWTEDLEGSMRDWVGRHLGWLQDSQHGQKAQSATQCVCRIPSPS